MDLSAARTAVYYSTYPIFYLLNFILFILAIITAPLLHLGSFCLYAYWYALHILSKFEASHTLYIFFGIAALVGIVTGMSLHYISGFIISLLNLDASPEERRGRTLASYRAEKRERWDAKEPIMKFRQKDEVPQRNDLGSNEDYLKWNSVKKDQGQGGNRFNTILEEDTSDGF